MRKTLFILSFLFLFSCSYFRENYREVNFEMESGISLRLIIFESAAPLSEKSLVVYANEYPLRGKNCEDSELQNFSRRLWSEIAAQNDLSKIKSGNVYLLRQQNQSKPEYCNFIFSKNNDGEWVQN